MPSAAELRRQLKERVKEVEPRDVHERLFESGSQNGSRNGAVLVDVREQHEWDESHIPGAVHVPKGYLESRIEQAAPDKSAPVILYCASGSRSVFAADTLESQLGYEDVASMSGGITLWKDRGYEIEVPRAL